MKAFGVWIIIARNMKCSGLIRPALSLSGSMRNRKRKDNKNRGCCTSEGKYSETARCGGEGCFHPDAGAEVISAFVGAGYQRTA